MCPLFYTVSDRHQFKNDRDLLYRFRYDDGTFRSKINSSDICARAIRAYCRLHGQFESLIRSVATFICMCVSMYVQWCYMYRMLYTVQGAIKAHFLTSLEVFARGKAEYQNWK